MKSEEEVLSSLIVDLKAWERDMDMSDKYVGELKAALEWFRKVEKPDWKIPEIRIGVLVSREGGSWDGVIGC